MRFRPRPRAANSVATAGMDAGQDPWRDSAAWVARFRHPLPTEVVMGAWVQVAGSLLVLAGFALAQRGVLDQKSRVYLLLNLVGSAVLAVDALLGRQWGFLL